MTTLARLLAAAGIVLLATGAWAQGSGRTYTVHGTNFDGSSYSGTARIEATGTHTCSIVWQTGTSSSYGNCMIRGDTLAASYTLDSGHVGLVIYDILPDGSLDGTWTVNNSDGLGTEVLEPR